VDLDLSGIEAPLPQEHPLRPDRAPL